MQLTFLDPPVLEGKRPPERVFGCTYGLYPIPNIFLLIAAAVLEKAGHTVLYVNMPLENWTKAEFFEFLKNDASDAYCIYSVNLSKKIDLLACQLIREVRGDTPIIFLGPAPTYNPKEFLFDERVIVIRGEPELIIGNLLKNLNNLKKVKGISYRKKGKIICNKPQKIIENLDKLPFPARHLLNNENRTNPRAKARGIYRAIFGVKNCRTKVRGIKPTIFNKNRYFNPKLGIKPFTAILTSRGCPYQCVYCVPCSLSFAREIEFKQCNKNKKPPYRMRSAENVVKEFKQLKDEEYNAVSILDDEFLIDKKRTLEICAGIKELGIKWGCLGRADHIDEETVKALAEAGCSYVDIGVESFNQQILDSIKKNLKVATIERAIKLLQKYGIMAKINILFGCSPLETKETIRQTISKIKELNPDSVMFGICNPFPGTEYYKTAKQKGWFIHTDYIPLDVQKGSNISYPHLTAKDLEKAVRKANFSFFLNPRFVVKQIKTANSFNSLVNAAKALWRKLF